MSTVEMLHQSAIDAKTEYTALVLSEAAGESEEHDVAGIRELLTIVGKSATDLEADIGVARERYAAAAGLASADQLFAEAGKLRAELPNLKAECNRVNEVANGMIQKAYAAYNAVETRERQISGEANRLRNDARQIMDPMGRRAIETAAEFQRQIEQVRASVAHDRSKIDGREVKDARTAINELLPQIERLERRIRNNGPASDRDDLAKARARFNESQAVVDHVESLRPLVEAADKRVLELEAEKQSALNTPASWNEVDFFETATNEQPLFGRPCIH